MTIKFQQCLDKNLDELGKISYKHFMDDHQNPAGEGDLLALSPSAQDPQVTAPSSLVADRLLRYLRIEDTQNLTPEQRLGAQAQLLDSLFTSMIFARPVDGQVYDERFNLAVALRAQKQSAQALAALSLIHHRRTRRDGG